MVVHASCLWQSTLEDCWGTDLLISYRLKLMDASKLLTTMIFECRKFFFNFPPLVIRVALPSSNPFTSPFRSNSNTWGFLLMMDLNVRIPQRHASCALYITMACLYGSSWCLNGDDDAFQLHFPAPWLSLGRRCACITISLVFIVVDTFIASYCKFSILKIARHVTQKVLWIISINKK